MQLRAWIAAAALLVPSALAQDIGAIVPEIASLATQYGPQVGAQLSSLATQYGPEVTRVLSEIGPYITQAEGFMSGLPNISFSSSQDPTRITVPKPGKALYTEEVVYCSDQTQLAVAIEAFDVTLWRENASLTFGFAFSSLAQNLELEANLQLTAYDMDIKNITVDLCEIIPLGLCRLPSPQFNLTGFGNYKLPDDYLSEIPGIAWQMPDLDAHARIIITDKGTGRGTCMQARLTNGWSVNSQPAKWVAGMFTMVAVLLALIQSLRKKSSSPALYRWFDILYLFQNAACTGLMSLNYPRVWIAFTRNFAWALGLIFNQPMQNTINKMRRSTGGKLPYTVIEELPATINRTLSGNTTNNGVDLGPLGTVNFGNIGGLTRIVNREVPKAIRSLIQYPKRALIPPPSANTESLASNVNKGIPTYVNGERIPVANGYSTVFFWFLACFAVLIAIHIVIAIFMLLLSLLRSKAPKWIVHLRRTWFQFCAGNFFRLCLAWTLPIVLFSFYQWKIGKNDAYAPIILGVVGWIVCVVPLFVVFIVEWSKNRKQSLSNPNVSRLWTDYSFFHSAGVLYRPYHVREHYFWFNPIMLGMIAKAGFIAFGNRNQWAQVIGCMVVEFFTLITILIFRPYRGIWNGIMGFLLCFFRLAVFGCLIAFIDSVKVAAIPRTIVGVVQIALVAIPTVLLFLDMVWTFFYDLFHFRRRHDDYEHLESPYYDETNEKDASQLRETLVANDSLRDTRLSNGGAPHGVVSPRSNMHDPFQPPRPFDDQYEKTPLTPDIQEHGYPSHTMYNYNSGPVSQGGFNRQAY